MPGALLHADSVRDRAVDADGADARHAWRRRDGLARVADAACRAGEAPGAADDGFRSAKETEVGPVCWTGPL